MNAQNYKGHMFRSNQVGSYLLRHVRLNQIDKKDGSLFRVREI